MMRRRGWIAAMASGAMLALTFPAMAAPVTIAVLGDSIGRGDGAVTRWDERLIEQVAGPVELVRRAVSRQNMQRLVNGIERENVPEGSIVIIYDRRNGGEAAADWIARLEEALALLPTDKVLVMPQVPVSGGREEPMIQDIMHEINATLRSTYPQLSFDAALEAQLLEALASDDTRSDRIHRNDAGQQIEADLMAEWLIARGWLEPAS